MKVASGIHRFTNGGFNWYVVEDAGRLTLVDAGFPAHYRLFTAGLRELGRSMGDVAAVVLTHAHADHTGFAARVAKEAGVAVYAHKADWDGAGRSLELPWLGLLSHAYRPYTARMLLHATVSGLFTLPTVTPTREIVDGEVLDVPGKPVAMHVPGHTPGEVALYFPDRGVLISGDALVTRDLYSGLDTPPEVPSPWLNSSYRVARGSLERLKELGELTLLPGHGQPWRGSVREAAELARQHAFAN